jgi:hypothetical protein
MAVLLNQPERPHVAARRRRNQIRQHRQRLVLRAAIGVDERAGGSAA